MAHNRESEHLAIRMLHNCYVKHNGKEYPIKEATYDSMMDMYVCFDDTDDVIAMLTESDMDELIEKREFSPCEYVTIKMKKGK